VWIWKQVDRHPVNPGGGLYPQSFKTITRGNTMIQQELNEENKEIKSKAYELYLKHGFKDGNDFVDWLEAGKQSEEQSRLESNQLEAEKRKEKRSRLKRNRQIKNILLDSDKMKNILLAIVILLCAVVLILFIMLFKRSSSVELSQKSMSELKVMMLVFDPKADEKVVVFGDTHFDFDQSTLSAEAKTLLDKDVHILNENPKINVRMAGYTSAKGTEDINQKISERRANAVRDYLIEKGIAPDRITTIGYGRTRPAVYEVTPGDIHSKEAMANMRVLFEIVVK
jgi:outer membrane protein OmpA-like peptidoglycan-associated protein